MRQPVDCLQSLIEFQLRKIDNNGAASSVSKPEWLKAGQKVEQQRLKIRDASSALSVAMNAVNLQLGGQLLRQHALQIHSISMVSQTFEDFQRSVGDGHSALTVQVDKLSSRLEDMAAHAQNPQPRESNAALCNDKAPSTDVGGSLTNSATATSSLHPPRQPVVIPSSKNEQLEEHRTANPALADCPDTKASYVRITASMNVRRCPKLCRCQCHVPTHYQTPRILRSLIGQLSLTHTGLLHARALQLPSLSAERQQDKFHVRSVKPKYTSWSFCQTLLHHVQNID